MQLLIIRHAIAEDREVFAASGRSDAERPLTAEGVRKMRRTARGLHQIVPAMDVLVASPLTRANETADILRREYEVDCIETAEALRPDAPLDDLVSWMAKYTAGVVAVVGHEPQLGRLVTYLVSGVDKPGVELKKGGATLIEFDGKPLQGSGRLRWSIPPGLLRDLAG